MKRRATTSAPALPADYVQLMRRVKARIATGQTRAALAANRELLRLYWPIGRDLVGDDGRNDYGTWAVQRLALDLASAFPGVQGLSARNLWRMRAFYLAHPAPAILPPPVAESSEPDLPASVPKRLVVEYALRDMKKPIGVAEWQTKLVAALPKALAGRLPTIEQIEKELRRG